jgi:hypothetical protein
MKQGDVNNYNAPMLTSIECVIEAGFGISDLSTTNSTEVPDFTNENTL